MHVRQYYFEYNGKQYPAGTILTVDPYYCHQKEKCTFEYCIPEKGWYHIDGLGWFLEETFYKMIIDITGEINEVYVNNKRNEILESRLTLSKEFCIDGLGLLWLWYIFLMGLTFLFKGFPIYWIVISVTFYIGRMGKLVELGYKKINGNWYRVNR